MIRIKPLRPAHREKKRYLVYEVTSEKNQLNMYTLQEQLVKKIHELLGVFQGSQAGIIPIKFDNKTQRGIIRINHTTVDLIRSCFVMITKLNNQAIQIHTKGVSGILKKAKDNYFAIQQKAN